MSNKRKGNSVNHPRAAVAAVDPAERDALIKLEVRHRAERLECRAVSTMRFLLKSQTPDPVGASATIALCEIHRLVMDRLVMIWYELFESEDILCGQHPPRRRLTKQGLHHCIDTVGRYTDLGMELRQSVEVAMHAPVPPIFLKRASVRYLMQMARVDLDVVYPSVQQQSLRYRKMSFAKHVSDAVVAFCQCMLVTLAKAAVGHAAHTDAIRVERANVLAALRDHQQIFQWLGRPELTQLQPIDTTAASGFWRQHLETRALGRWIVAPQQQQQQQQHALDEEEENDSTSNETSSDDECDR